MTDSQESKAKSSETKNYETNLGQKNFEWLKFLKVGLKDEKRTKWMKSVKEREKRLIEREGKEKEREREIAEFCRTG